VATYARCHTILATDAPDLQRDLAADFRAVIADLGIGTAGDLRRRAGQVRDAWPGLKELASTILARNPEVAGNPEPAGTPGP